MSFGKMGGKGPREPRVERQSVPDRTPAPIRVSRQAKVDHDDEESSVWYIWAAMIGGLLLIVLATCWLVANQYDQIASQSSDARSTRGKFDFSHTFAMTGVPAATLERNMTLRSACTLQLNHTVKTRRNDPPTHAVDPNSGALKYNYAAAGEALNCLLLNEQSRLCEAGERRKIVYEINSYLERYQAERRNAERIAANPMARTFALVRERLDAADGESTPDDVTANAVTASVSTRLIEAVEWASDEGYLASADFGLNVPAELAPHFNKPRKTPCKS